MGKLRKNTALMGGLGDLQTSNVCNKKELGWERGFSIALLLLLWSSIDDRKTKNCEDLLDRSQTFKLVWISQTSLLYTRYSTDNKIIIIIFYYSVLNDVVVLIIVRYRRFVQESISPAKVYQYSNFYVCTKILFIVLKFLRQKLRDKNYLPCSYFVRSFIEFSTVCKITSIY